MSNMSESNHQKHAPSPRMRNRRHRYSLPVCAGAAVLLGSYGAGWPAFARGTAQQREEVVLEDGSLQSPIPPPGSGREVSREEFEKLGGISDLSLGLGGKGGLIELRFKVVNREKAQQMLSRSGGLPLLRVGDGKTQLAATRFATRGVRLQQGAYCSILYPNVRNLVKEGTPVSALFGSVFVDLVNAR